MGDSAALHAVAQGRVQGINYRAFVSREAARLVLTGYVRNLADGSVEICAEGDRTQLVKLVEHLKAGPPGARVESLALSWSDYSGQYNFFSVRR
jgi:acylphosphatase